MKPASPEESHTPTRRRTSARSVPRRKAPGWSCPGATPTGGAPRSRSVPPSIPAPCGADIRLGNAQARSPTTSVTIARVEPGGECLAIHARTGCRTGSSNPTKTSSRCAAKPGTTSSTNHGRSCPSACANGRMGSDQTVGIRKFASVTSLPANRTRSADAHSRITSHGAEDSRCDSHKAQVGCQHR